MDALLQNTEFLRKLREVPPELTEQYAAGRPFPHLTMDDFLPVDVAQRVLDCFPSPIDLTWQKYNNANEVKLAFRQVENLPGLLRELLFFLNAQPMLNFVERLTGIPGLIADMNYVGGGLHQIPRGGKLAIHLDFNKLQPWNLDRRLNLILYMNQDWKEEYGGHFELWDEAGQECVKKVLPVFNRCLIFNTDDHSYHGHPHPLTCPEGRTRKSVAIYYYTVGRPAAESQRAHNTVWLGQGEAPINGAARAKARGVARYLTPPILYDFARFCKRKIVPKKS
jgi:2OG-Fe(II) oxygenase superfamily